MSQRFVALLRGINVGRAKRVAMADLRALTSALGYRDVSTLLNSGNLVFTAPASDRRAPGPRLEEAIATRLKVSSRVIVLTAAELAAIVKRNPLEARTTDPSRMFVTVLADASARARLVPLARAEWGPDGLVLGKQVAYLWCEEGGLKSPLSLAASRVLGDAATTRNWNTMTKLHLLASGSA